MNEIYRAIKTTRTCDTILSTSIVYVKKEGRYIEDSEGTTLTLPRKDFNKKGKFSSRGYRNKILNYWVWDDYKITEKVQ